MVSTTEIEKVDRRIGEIFHPERVILFGSYASGKPTPDSDVDLLVITGFKGRPVNKFVEIRMRIRPHFPIDLIVRSSQKNRVHKLQKFQLSKRQNQMFGDSKFGH